MAKKTQRNLGGRPRSQDRSELTAALIARQDAFAKRTARQLVSLLDTHLPGDQADRAWAWERARIRDRMIHFVGALAPQIVAVKHEGVIGVERAIKSGVYTLLRDLAEDKAMPPAVERPPDPTLERPGKLGPSKSLAAARARSARLQAQVLDIKARIVGVTPQRRRR